MENIKKELDLSISDEEKDIAYVNKLNRTKDKIKYLRFVKGYTQKKTAKMIGISERHVKRLEKELKMSP
ncbi:sigma factor-like helix-turn-helix DNA-binding protein [Candidatus Clostridium helianthi]|uniref:Sigma factor-like helix-turn-helix DNA-binding protein n=1 Tax=Candidatus Clostridium helianthi TaxID=3381660 RepID=A0ABW8SD36_9CLOT